MSQSYTLERYIEEKACEYIRYVTWNPRFLHESKRCMPVAFPEPKMIHEVSDTVKQNIDKIIIEECQKYLQNVPQTEEKGTFMIQNSLKRDWRHESDMCEICFVTIESDSDIVIFRPCGHMICFHCYFRGKLRESKKCPFCRHIASDFILMWNLQFYTIYEKSILEKILKRLKTLDDTLIIDCADWN